MKLQILNKLTEEQISEIKRFDEEQIADYISDPYTFNIGIVVDDSKINRILALGVIRVINEFKMVIKPEISSFKKAQIVKLLLEEAIKLRNCNEIVSFTTKGGWAYKELLKEHFNFYEINGFPLRLEI